MSYLADVLSPKGRQASSGTFAEAMDPRFWPQDEDTVRTASGLYVNPENAMAVGAVYRCVSILSGVVAYLPLHIYKRLDEGGKERATQHPLYKLFTLKPNGQNTVEHWLRLTVAHLELRGNSYHEIVPGPRGIVDKLIPLHPSRVEPEVNNQDGRGWVCAHTATMTKSTVMRYKVLRDGGNYDVLTEDDVFHIRGLGTNGLVGLSRISLMRETLGLSIAINSHVARTFANAATPRGIYSVDGEVDPDAYARLKLAVRALVSERTLIMEQGAKWQQLGMTNEDAQSLELSGATASQVCGWFGVPPHLISQVDKTSSWGTGIAEQNLALLVYTIAPILEAIEQAIDGELIVADDRYFAEFLPDKLLRMDPLQSATAENVRLNNGTLNRNESRSINNRNPVEGGNKFMVPLNMKFVGDEPAPAPNPFNRFPAPAPPEEDEEPPAKEPPAEEEQPPTKEPKAASHTMRRAAAHCVRKESNWIRTWAPRLEKDPATWLAKTVEFYVPHASMVSDWMGIPVDQALVYIEGQQAALIQHGPVEWIAREEDRAAALVALALEWEAGA